MAKLSISNGHTFTSAEDISEEDLARHWDVMVTDMDDDTREEIHHELEADITNREFLQRYLERAPYDLVIG